MTEYIKKAIEAQDWIDAKKQPPTSTDEKLVVIRSGDCFYPGFKRYSCSYKKWWDIDPTAEEVVFWKDFKLPDELIEGLYIE